MKIKYIIFIPAIIFTMLLAGCTRNSKANMQELSTLSSLTPKQSVQTMIKSLKNADANVYNQLIQYKDERHGAFIYKDNKVFGGNNPDSKSKEMLEALFLNLSYDIKNVKVDGKTSIVKIKISNRDFSKINITNIIKYKDADNPLTKAIKDTDSKITSNTVNIALNKVNHIWKVSMDSSLVSALCGGLSVRSFLN